MDRLASLATFVEAAQSRSFTAAARRVGVSPSAVGKTIVRLEERLGVRLFHRSTRSITLTTEGAAFLKRCLRIFEEIEAAELEMAQSNAVPRGRLKVSMPLVGMLLTPAVSGFARAYPDIELELDFSDRLVDVIEEGFDVVMRTGQAVDSQLVTRTLGTYGYAVVASPEYLARAGPPKEPEDLLAHVCLQHRWPSSGKLESWRLSRDGVPLDLELPASIVCSTIEPLIGMAERGIGITCLPIFALRRQIDEGRLVPLLDRYLRETGTFRMLWASGRHLTPKVRAFVDFMAENVFPEDLRQN